MGAKSESLRARGWQDVDEAVLDGNERDLELVSGEQLRTLADGLRLRLLTSLGRQPGSAKELAERFGVPTTRLYHHLDLLEEHGFIRVVATRQSGARTERCYGMAPLRSIRPARQLVDAEDRSELGASLRAIAEVVGVTLEEAVRAGTLEVPTDDAEIGRSIVTWSTARLTRAQQEQFSQELSDVIGRMIEASAANLAEGADVDPGELESAALFVALTPDVLLPD